MDTFIGGVKIGKAMLDVYRRTKKGNPDPLVAIRIKSGWYKKTFEIIYAQASILVLLVQKAMKGEDE